MSVVMEMMGSDYAAFTKKISENNVLQEVIVKEAKGKFAQYLSFFIRLNTLYDAIYSALHMVEFEKQLKRELYKKTMYPLFIFLISFFTVYLFSEYVIPQLFSSFDNQENQLLYNILAFIKNGSTLIMLLFICFLFIILMINKNKIVANLFYLHAVPHIGLCRDYISYHLCGYLKTLHERGLSSRQSFQFLSELKGSHYLVKTIHSINQKLSSGCDIISVMQDSQYLSERFKMNFMIGAHNGEFESTLDSYMLLQQEHWFHLIKIISIVVQCIAYLFIGILVICVYQIMLIPLQMIEDM